MDFAYVYFTALIAHYNPLAVLVHTHEVSHVAVKVEDVKLLKLVQGPDS